MQPQLASKVLRCGAAETLALSAGAASKGHAALVTELLRLGADRSIADSRGATPLALAQKAGHIAVVELLNQPTAAPPAAPPAAAAAPAPATPPAAKPGGAWGAGPPGGAAAVASTRINKAEAVFGGQPPPWQKPRTTPPVGREATLTRLRCPLGAACGHEAETFDARGLFEHFQLCHLARVSPPEAPKAVQDFRGSKRETEQLPTTEPSAEELADIQLACAKLCAPG